MNLTKLLLLFVLASAIHTDLRAQITCASLEGAYVVGQDYNNTYLGFFGSEYAVDSIMNPYSLYGSEYGVDSVRNPYSTFGSPYSSYSANNSLATSPPGIFRQGQFIAYLTTNSYQTPGVSLGAIDAACTFYSSTPDTSPGGGTTYSLTVSKNGSGSGSVSSNPSGINCGASCSANYSSGTSVTLTANAASGSAFAGWSGACSGTSSCTVSMTQSRSVTATFNATATNYTLSISKSGAGSGAVISSPAGISCGSSCSANFSAGTNVTLTASPASGSTFGGWSGSCSGLGSCTVSMTVARSVTATFNTSEQIEAASELSGLWYNPAQDGHGFSISVHSPTSASAYWYTFDPFGNALWIYGAADIVGNRMEATAYFLQGMEFGTWDPATKEVYEWGSFEIEFHSCDSATLTYDSTLAYSSGEEFGSGTMPLVRLASVAGVECGSEQGAGPVPVEPVMSGGLWYNPAQDGHGFSISTHSPTSASAYWYTFDPFGNALWIYGAGDIVGNRLEATAYVLNGMEFGIWDPATKEVYEWGSFEIEFHSCDSATLTYDSTLSYTTGEEFGSGTIPLVMLAGLHGLECD